MKRLISAADVKAAAKNGGVLAIDDNTIVTPQAKDEAAERGVELVFAAAPVVAQHKACAPAPEFARDVLPTSLKTEIIVTMNLREWRHFFRLRAAGTTGRPHPQMRQVAQPLLEEMRRFLPEIFGDI